MSFTCRLMRWKGVLSTLLLCYIALASPSQSYSDTHDYSLSEITVLLPYTSVRQRVKYQLHARAAGHSSSCFKFKAMNTDIILVEPLYTEDNPKGCSSSASISVAPHLHGVSRVSTFVVAEDICMYLLLPSPLPSRPLLFPSLLPLPLLHLPARTKLIYTSSVRKSDEV